MLLGAIVNRAVGEPNTLAQVVQKAIPVPGEPDDLVPEEAMWWKDGNMPDFGPADEAPD